MVARMKIRFAKINEFSKCKKFDSSLTSSRFQSMVKEKEIVIAVKGAEIIGYLRLQYIWIKIPYLSWIMVKEEWRQTGVAKELLDFLESFLRNKKFKFLLSSYQNNAPQSKLWHSKMGFKPCGKIREINEDRSVEVFCQLRI